MTHDPKIVEILRGKTLAETPLWLMRQAGRYLPEYRALKEKHSFLELCRSPELALEVSLQPLRRFNLDAAIVFSDILVPAPGLGFDLDFRPGPVISNKLRSPDELSRLTKSSDAGIYRPTCETISLLRTALKTPTHGTARPAVLGFSGSPWTLACYLIDQGPYHNFLGTQVFAERHPSSMQQFLELLTEVVSDYLIAQVESGADAVQIFDSWGGVLSQDNYRRWSLPSIVAVIERVKQAGAPIILYTNGSSPILTELAQSGADCLSIDSRTRPHQFEASGVSGMAVQGNLDPCDLFSTPAEVRKRTQQMLEEFRHHPRHIANLGHGILPETPIENVETFISTVKEFSRNAPHTN